MKSTEIMAAAFRRLEPDQKRKLYAHAKKGTRILCRDLASYYVLRGGG